MAMLKKLAIVMICLVSLCLPMVAATAAGTPDPQFERPKDRMDVEAEKKMEKARNEQRHAELKRDTERLLELATELKQYVDKTNESILSLDVVKKAEEIEKLAKNVRNRMKESVK